MPTKFLISAEERDVRGFIALFFTPFPGLSHLGVSEMSLKLVVEKPGFSQIISSLVHFPISIAVCGGQIDFAT